MAKKVCSKCGEALNDRKLIACPACGEFIKKQRLWETGNGRITIGFIILALLGLAKLIVRISQP